eukprot:g5159.t1
MGSTSSKEPSAAKVDGKVGGRAAPPPPSTEKAGILGESAKEAFAQIDADGDGSLDMDELSMLFCQLGLELSDDELAEKFERIDTDSDGRISFEEFQISWEQIREEAKASLKGIGGKASAVDAKDSVNALRKVWEEEREYHEKRPSILHYLFDAFAYHAKVNRKLSHVNVEGLLKLSRCLYFREVERRKEKRKEYMELSRPLPRQRRQTEPTARLINDMLDLLDEDGSERIEWDEFQQFFVVGAQMQPAARRAVNEGNPTMRFALELVDNVLEENHLMMELALQEQYKHFDKDQSGSMSSSELLEWMKSVHRETGSSTVEPTVEVADRVIQFLDEDASGTLEQKEWLDWLRQGHLTMLDEKRRKQYSVEGGKHAECIVDFLDMVVLQASKRTGEMVKSMAAEHEEKFDSDPRVNDETHKEEAVTSRESSGDVASQDLKLGQQDSTST